jgi:hypothetical protein
VHIPKTCEYRADLTYAKLLLRVYPRRRMANAFEGKLLKPGAVIDEKELWPTADYPAVPLLLEFAGNDHTGHGHRRSNDIYVLWRYDGDRWTELVRSAGRGADWIEHLKPVALRELARTAPPADPDAAAGISSRVLGVLDRELELLDAEARHLVMAFVYQEFTSRTVTWAA